jgi:hypothetical protein
VAAATSSSESTTDGGCAIDAATIVGVADRLAGASVGFGRVGTAVTRPAGAADCGGGGGGGCSCGCGGGGGGGWAIPGSATSMETYQGRKTAYDSTGSPAHAAAPALRTERRGAAP